MDRQFQIGDHRTEMGLQLVSRDRNSFFCFKTEGEWPDTDFHSRREAHSAAPHYFVFPNQATVRANILKFEFTINESYHSMMPRNERAAQYHTVTLVTADVDFVRIDFDHRPAAFVDLIEPNLHNRVFRALIERSVRVQRKPDQISGCNITEVQLTRLTLLCLLHGLPRP